MTEAEWNSCMDPDSKLRLLPHDSRRYNRWTWEPAWYHTELAW